MKVPVIIINWNGYQDTLECLNSVLKTEDVDFIIYLIDNGSENDEGNRLTTEFELEHRIIVWQFSENLGFAKANNVVLKELIQSNHNYVALLNNDTIVDPQWLVQMLQTADEMNAQMISAKLLNYFNQNQIDNLGHQMLNTGEIIPIAHQEDSSQYDQPIINFGSCAGATLYSANMLKTIGIFDPFFSTGYEDAELGARAILAGYRSALSPAAIVYHKMGRSVKKVFSQEYALMIQSAIWYTYFKLMPLGVIIASLPFILLKQLMLSLINIVFGRWYYLSIQWKAIHVTFTKHRKLILSGRKNFFNSVDTISSLQILSKQRFFLLFDIKRFYRIFIRRKKSALDQYGGE
ncbi:MAG: glycosyltransferase family 2 protein [Saprospiraceae bacterium]|nr:glycosyltransferase family 2 protein [Saprospiraceae bacterium]